MSMITILNGIILDVIIKSLVDRHGLGKCYDIVIRPPPRADIMQFHFVLFQIISFSLNKGGIIALCL